MTTDTTNTGCECFETDCDGKLCEHGTPHGAEHHWPWHPRISTCSVLTCDECEATHIHEDVRTGALCSTLNEEA